jgi:hypothetical protein
MKLVFIQDQRNFVGKLGNMFWNFSLSKWSLQNGWSRSYSISVSELCKAAMKFCLARAV